jgi:acetolactate synthase-1/2/3 large subunit
VLLLGSGACGEAALAAAGRLAAHGVRVLTDTFTARQARGEGRFRPDKLPYFGEQALKDLDGVDLMVLVATTDAGGLLRLSGPAQRAGPRRLRGRNLCGREVDAAAALNALADAVGAPAAGAVETYAAPEAPAGRFDAWAIGASIAKHMPTGRMISDDAVTAGLPIFTQTKPLGS